MGKAVGAALALLAASAFTAPSVPRFGAGRRRGRVARHAKPPKAGPVTLQLGDVVIVNGSSYQVQLVPGLVPFTTPIPTPTPAPKPALTGIRNRLTGLLVSSATAGTPLSLEGTLLGTAAGRVQLAGRIAASPTAWSQTAIQFLAPDPGPAAVTGGWDVYQPSGNTFTVIASSGAFTLLPRVLPGPTPTPTPTPTPLPQALSLTVTGFRDAMGALTQSFAPGSTVFIQGQGFGTQAGTVAIGVNPVPVLAWTPTELQVKCPAGSGPQMLTVTSADGKQWDRLKGFSIGGLVGANQQQ